MEAPYIEGKCACDDIPPPPPPPAYDAPAGESSGEAAHCERDMCGKERRIGSCRRTCGQCNDDDDTS